MTATARRRSPGAVHRGQRLTRSAPSLAKAPTGIAGLDEITNGGLPRGRPTLVCGGAGCGKTLLGLEFLVRGALDHDEPGVFMSFEETPDDLIENARSLGFDLRRLAARRQLTIDYVTIDRTELMIFIRPQVIRNPEEARAVTEEFRKRLTVERPMSTRGRDIYDRDANRILR